MKIEAITIPIYSVGVFELIVASDEKIYLPEVGDYLYSILAPEEEVYDLLYQYFDNETIQYIIDHALEQTVKLPYPMEYIGKEI